MIKNEKKTGITPQTLVYDLLTEYPELEEKLIEIAPVFVKLRNPVLRRTIAKITTLKQAAIVADLSLADLINSLRKAAGEDTLLNEVKPEVKNGSPAPDWVENSVVSVTYDAREDLQNGSHPLARIMGEISKLENDQHYVLITPFNPAPLIQKVQDKGFETWTRSDNGRVETFIKRGTA
jgi:uncharacterized protein (DUF2249 family)